MSVNRSTVFSAMIWKLLERGGVQVITFIVTIVIARILTPEDYGIIALVSVFMSISGVIVDGGLNMALIQKKDANQTDFSTIFYASLGVSSLLYLLLYISAPYIASFYNNNELIPVIRVLGITLFFYAFNSIQNAYLSRHLLFKSLFYSSLGAIVLSGAVGIILALLGYGVWALVFQNIVLQGATCIIMWFTVKWRPTLEFSKERFGKLFDFGWKIFVSNLIISLFNNARSLIIGKVYNAGSLAYYDRGRQFPSLIVENINSSVNAVVFPVLSEEQDKPQVLKNMVRRSIKTSTFVICPLVVGLGVIADPMVRVLLTEKWLGAVPFIQIFCIAYLLLPMQITNLAAIKALGHSGISLKLEVIKKCVELVILIISVLISVESIAWGIVVYNAICLFINTAPNARLLNYGVKEQLKDIAPAFGTSFLMGISIYWIQLLPLSSFFIMSLMIVIGAILYIFLNVLFKVEAFYYLKDILQSKINKN